MKNTILNWYSSEGRILPWRKTRDPYRVWISEVMLQQTTVATIINRYDQWFMKFPTLEDLSNANEEEVLKAFQGLGYYSRAINLLKTAKILNQSSFPKDPESLEKLPGFGPYMSHSIAALCFDEPTVPIDVNTHRIACRILAANLNHEEARKFWKKELFHSPPHFANEVTQALMDLGSLFCKKTKPQCHLCPLNNICKAFSDKTVDLFPIHKIKSPKVTIVSLRFVMKKDDSYLIGKREMWFKGFYDFPEIIIQSPHLERIETVSLLQSMGLIKFKLSTPALHAITHHKIQAWAVEVDDVNSLLKNFLDLDPFFWTHFLEINKRYVLPQVSYKLLNNSIN